MEQPGLIYLKIFFATHIIFTHTHTLRLKHTDPNTDILRHTHTIPHTHTNIVTLTHTHTQTLTQTLTQTYN